MKEKIPDFQSIMLPLLKMLQDGKSYSMNQVMDIMANHFKLKEDDLRVRVPSGQQPLFKNRVAWAISYLKNSGLVEYPQRGVYKITESGHAILAKNPTNINISYLKQLKPFQEWQEGFAETEQKQLSENSVLPGKTLDEILGEVLGSLEAKLELDILDQLKAKPPAFFEKFVLKLLSKMGYGMADESSFEVVGKSGDNGIDGIIYQDQFGIDRVYVQAKRWSDNKVQSKDIRDFIGSLSLKGTNKGIFITTSNFTDDAVKTVQMNPQNRIILVNGSQLAGFAIRNNVGVQVVRELWVKEIDNDFFEEL
jgi:restriction system protein